MFVCSRGCYPANTNDTPRNQHQMTMETRMIRVQADTPEKTRSRLEKMDGV